MVASCGHITGRWQDGRRREFKAPRVLIAAFPALPLCSISKPRNLKLRARKPI